MKKLHLYLFWCLLAAIYVLPTNAFADKKSHSHSSDSFTRVGHSITINMTMTIPQLVGPVPVGGNVDLTPFALSPKGKITKGLPTNVVPASGLIQALNPVVIHHPVQGNYVIGYYVSLGSNSPTFSVNTIANFSGIVLNNPSGAKLQTITIPIQTLFLSSLATADDVLTISANFPLVK